MNYCSRTEDSQQLISGSRRHLLVAGLMRDLRLTDNQSQTLWWTGSCQGEFSAKILVLVRRVCCLIYTLRCILLFLIYYTPPLTRPWSPQEACFFPDRSVFSSVCRSTIMCVL